jgi:lipopolysaccharide heptosyltransferase II
MRQAERGVPSTRGKIGLLKAADKLVGSVLVRLLPDSWLGEACPKVPRSVLFVRPGGIGDAILLLPAIRALKEAYPHAAIDVLAERRNGQGFFFFPHVRHIFFYDRGPELCRVLRNRYDVVIDTEQWHRLSAVVVRLIRAPLKIGYATNERKKLFNHPVPYSHDDYEKDSFFKLLEPLGIKPPAGVETPFIEIEASASKRAGELLGWDFLHRPFIALFPGASIPERRWGAERFQAVAAALAKEGILSVVLGGREDVAEGAKIVTDSKSLNLAGLTSLAETAAVIGKCAVLVSGDSGILHIGVGLGRPTVSLFGPGIAKKWAPRGPDHIVLNKNFPCSPCTKFGYTPKCPDGARCLQGISVEEVADAVMNLFCRNTEGMSH